MSQWLLIALGVLLVAVVTFDVVVGVRQQTVESQATSSSAAITAAFDQAPAQAETAATRILGYDYKTLQDDADEAKYFMTPAYAATFQKTVDGLLKARANQVKAHVEAEVKASGVVSATASEVDVMLFIDQTSQTTQNSAPADLPEPGRVHDAEAGRPLAGRRREGALTAGRSPGDRQNNRIAARTPAVTMSTRNRVGGSLPTVFSWSHAVDAP